MKLDRNERRSLLENLLNDSKNICEITDILVRYSSHDISETDALEEIAKIVHVKI